MDIFVILGIVIGVAFVLSWLIVASGSGIAEQEHDRNDLDH